jgi:nucleotide-binding universal stress UspA family protein
MTVELIVVSTFRLDTHIPVREIVVPVDPESLDLRALETATTLARQLGASVSIVAVAAPLIDLPDDWKTTLHGLVAELSPLPCRAVIARSESVADGLLASIGDLRQAIVCMTTEAPGRLRDAFDLSSTSAVVHHVECPVLLCGPHAEATISAASAVVAFVDDSEMADRVVATAADWAATMGVPLWVVEVVDPRTRVAADVNETAYVARLAHRHQRPGQDVEWDVVHDREPADAIATYLRDKHPAAIAVLGSHGRTGWAELRLGSVSMRTVHGAPCPVLLVPPDRN